MKGRPVDRLKVERQRSNILIQKVRRMTKGKIFQFCINCVEGTACVPACSY